MKSLERAGAAEDRQALLEPGPVFAKQLQEWFGKPKAYGQTPLTGN